MGTTWPRRLLHQVLQVRPLAPRRHRPLTVERLEDRCVPSTLQAISLPPANQPPSDSAAGASDSPSVSADGRYVAFQSKAPNLVPGETGAQNVENVYLLDRTTNQVTLVSHVPGSFTAAPTSGFPSYSPIISPDGRFILYGSEAPEFAPGLTPFGSVVMLYNVQTQQNTLLSHVSGSPTTPADGPNGGSANSDPDAVSSNGQYVLFASNGTDLVPGQGSSAPVNQEDASARWLYLYNTTDGSTQLVDHAAGQNNVTDKIGFDSGFIGQNGQVVYAKVGTASVADNGLVAYVDGSDNVISGFTGTAFDVYLYDPTTRANQLVSFDPASRTQGAGGAGLAAVISADGSAVAYVSDDNVVAGMDNAGMMIDNVFRYDVSSETNTLVSAAAGTTTTGGNANSGASGLSLAVSRNGLLIAFTSSATDLVPQQSGAAGNVFLYDAGSASLTLLSGVNGSATVGAGGVPDLTPSGIPTGPVGPTGPADPITGAEFLGGPQVLSMSEDGGLVAYVSNAGAIVPGQSSPVPADNVFLYDGSTGRTTLESGVGGSATVTATRESSDPVLAGLGSVLVFHSLAPDLTAGLFDGNGVADVFTAAPGTPGAALASRAAFPDPQAPGDSFATSVSADGRYTVFTSNATNLVTNQVTVNTQQNIFLYDSQTGTVRLVNHVPGAFNTTGDGGVHPDFFPSTDSALPPPDFVKPVISADGNWIAFASFDDNLVPNEAIPPEERNQPVSPGPPIEFIYLYNVSDQTITLVNHAPGEPATIQAPSANGGVFYDSFQPAISYHGDYVAFAFGEPGDDGVGVALYSRATDSTTIIASYPDLDAMNFTQTVPRDPSISDSGQFVAYGSGTDGTNVSVYDRTSGTTTLVSHAFGSSLPADGTSSGAVISHDGTAIAFVSTADDLVSAQISGGAAGLTNVFLYKVAGGAVSLVSGAGGSDAVTGDGNSDSPAIDLDGTYVAYRSDATNLVSGQTASGSNVYEFNTQAGTQTLVSHVAGDPTTAAGGSSEPVIDDDGHLVSYVSTAGDLIPGQSAPADAPAGVKNVFIWLRPTNANILASGQGGSPTVTCDADSDGPLLTRNSFPGFSSRARNLLQGVAGTSVAYINTLVALVLSPNTIVLGTPAGSVVGTLSVSSLLVGQYLPPTYRLPAGQASDALFALGATAGGTAPLLTQFLASAVQVYVVRIDVDVGFGNDPVFLQVAVAPGAGPPPAGGGPHGITAQLVPVRVGKKRATRLMVKVFDAVTGEETESFLSPFQKPAFKAIQVSVRDSNGDGVPDEVVLTARKGKKTMTRIIPG
jgi:hypothetical protein